MKRITLAPELRSQTTLVTTQSGIGRTVAVYLPQEKSPDFSWGRGDVCTQAKTTRAPQFFLQEVYFGTSNVEHANWIDRVTKLEKRLNLWKSRTLSLKGKSLIINSIGASGLWYTATVLPIPDWVVTRVNKAIYDFLWNDKTEIAKRTTCQLRPFITAD